MSNIDENQHDDEEDVQNDAVIASALRASLIVFMLLGLPVIGFLIYLNISDPEEGATEAEVTPPQQRQENEQAIPPLVMENVAASAGIDFMHESGREGQKLLPETMGSGAAVLDYNGDGHQDLLFVNSTRWPWDTRGQIDSPSRLYQGDGKFHFTDVTEQAGIGNNLYGMGVAVGDYDNDGDTDIFLSAVGRNRLLKNEEGVFEDVTDAAGVGGGEDTWGTSCGFFDYDNDGLLDLFVCNYVTWSKDADLSQKFTLDGESRAYGPPKAFSGSFSYLYHNNGNGSFTDVSEAAGIQIRNDDTGVPLGKAMGLAPVDFNGDG